MITPTLNKKQIAYTYATEADVINVALFGMTAKKYKEQFPEIEGNLRDNATIEQLAILNNLQSHNAQMIEERVPHNERIIKLNRLAIRQQEILFNNNPKALETLKSFGIRTK